MPNPKEEQPKLTLTPRGIRKLIGDTKKVAQEMKVFRRRAREYDPMPDKTLILGGRMKTKRAA